MATIDTDVRNCPKCGSDEISFGFSAPPMTGVVECHADGCEVLAVAATEDAAIALWNGGVWTHELVDRDDNGIPEYRATQLA